MKKETACCLFSAAWPHANRRVASRMSMPNSRRFELHAELAVAARVSNDPFGTIRPYRLSQRKEAIGTPFERIHPGPRTCPHLGARFVRMEPRPALAGGIGRPGVVIPCRSSRLFWI